MPLLKAAESGKTLWMEPSPSYPDLGTTAAARLYFNASEKSKSENYESSSTSTPTNENNCNTPPIITRHWRFLHRIKALYIRDNIQQLAQFSHLWF